MLSKFALENQRKYFYVLGCVSETCFQRVTSELEIHFPILIVYLDIFVLWR